MEGPFKAVISKRSCLGLLGLLTAYKTVKGDEGANLPLLKKSPWDDPEGWYGEGGGFRVGNTCIPVADSF